MRDRRPHFLPGLDLSRALYEEAVEPGAWLIDRPDPDPRTRAPSTAARTRYWARNGSSTL